MHKLLEILLILVTGCLFTLLIRIRPNAKPLSNKKLIGIFVVGVIIGIIFLSTQNYNAPTTSGL
ncbi:hypothetical protein [Alicyclobacillus dauci]|uniref:Uncharacterized protein n=1 Tax=Alicyclobacillus dauci TaxID=1475485 RepID=A0ABY6Z1R3_9BACL|nr:hypothetical protein [Alicyclobacillus dauci]WAH36685.1 hypothetical protein NZD86_21330 [Alicyclobacillus dauci]